MIVRRISGTFGRVQVVYDREKNIYYALKTMSIKRIVESKQIEHVRNEKYILSKINHPFVVRLYWATHTSSLLYLLLEYLPGGELFQMMRKREKFDAKTAIFYASEVLLALDYLHHLDVVYRDLKPVCRRHSRAFIREIYRYRTGFLYFRKTFSWMVTVTFVSSTSALPRRRRNARSPCVVPSII